MAEHVDAAMLPVYVAQLSAIDVVGLTKPTPTWRLPPTCYDPIRADAPVGLDP